MQSVRNNFPNRCFAPRTMVRAHRRLRKTVSRLATEEARFVNKVSPMQRLPLGLPRFARSPGVALSLLAGLSLASIDVNAAGACTAQSGPSVAPLVELYTSEGCNSCPPADRWLSKLKADPSVVALAFHVDYWDRLGWKDRFAKPGFTERQSAQQASNGARFSYTPQVVVDGHDRKDWPQAAPAGSRPAATVGLALAREGDGFVATVSPSTQAPRKLAAYWAVTEQGHVTAVKAGENDGVTLHHDFVVRDYEAVAAWSPKAGSADTLRYKPSLPADADHPRSVNLVVIDAASGKPLQALKLSC